MRTVALLGPDGAGKSTVLSAMEQVVGRESLQIHHFRARPRAKARAAVTNPYRKTPHPAPIALLKMLWWILGHLGWGLSMRFKRDARKPLLVVFDRFLYDIVADPLRYRVPQTVSTLPAFAPIWPRPDLVVILEPSPDVIQSRKQEVTRAQTDAQIASYRNLRLPGVEILRIPGVEPPEVIAGMILNRLS